MGSVGRTIGKVGGFMTGGFIGSSASKKALGSVGKGFEGILGKKGAQKEGTSGGLSIGESAAARKMDFEAGLKRGEDLIGEGDLGRIGTDPAIAQALEMQRSRLGGLTGAEMQGQRDVAGQGIARSTELARRRLAGAQARAGVRGATAGAQQMGVLQQGIQAQQGLEQNLLMGNRAAQGAAISDVLGQGAETKKFDLSQAARERFAQLQTALASEQMGVSERAGVAANNATVAAANAAKPSGGILGAITGK